MKKHIVLFLFISVTLIAFLSCTDPLTPISNVETNGDDLGELEQLGFDTSMNTEELKLYEEYSSYLDGLTVASRDHGRGGSRGGANRILFTPMVKMNEDGEILRGRPWGFFAVRSVSEVFGGKMFLVGAEPYAWYVVSMTSDNEPTQLLLSTIGGFEANTGSRADIGLVKVGRRGASWYWLPEVDGELSYDEPVIPAGQYEDIKLTFKFLGTEDSPNWRYIYENSTDDLHSWWPLDFTIGDVYMVGPDGATVTAADGGVTLEVPSGALAEEIGLTIEPVEIKEGALSAYHFGPDGLTFDEPARVTFTYDPARLPVGIEETDVDIFVIDGDQGEIIQGTVDTDANTVSGFINGFSVIGITGSSTLYIEPSSLQVPLGGSEAITVVYDDSYYTAPYLYSSDTSVATVDQGGVVSGVATGTAHVGAMLDHPVSFTMWDDQYTIPIPYNTEIPVQVASLNSPPVAVDDSGTTTQDTPVIIDVLENDSDQDGDTLSVLTTSDPGNGTVEVLTDQTVEYTPVNGFSGDDQFTYTISDGYLTATATVTVSVTPVQTLSVSISSSYKSGSLAVELSGEVSGPCGAPFTYRWNFGDGSTEEGVLESGTTISPSIGGHIYESYGEYDITLDVTACDGSATGSDTVTVVLTSP